MAMDTPVAEAATGDIARRTVAKYREQIGIQSASKRKRVF